MKKQRTIQVEDKKIKVLVNSRTYMKNFIGFSAVVTDGENSLSIPQVAVLSADKAIDKAYVQFVQKYY